MIVGSISGALHNNALHHLPTWMYLPELAPLSSSRGCFCQADAVNEKLVCNRGGNEMKELSRSLTLSCLFLQHHLCFGPQEKSVLLIESFSALSEFHV